MPSKATYLLILFDATGRLRHLNIS